MTTTSPLLDAMAMRRVLARMASEIVERVAADGGPVVLVGIQTRGVQLADRLAPLVAPQLAAPLQRGVLGITLYRDDLSTIGPSPVVHETRLPPRLDGTTVVIVDDVLFTGRTVRAALDEMADFGRPRRILLAVLVDRGGRELPIAADVVGLTVTTRQDERIMVRVSEVDGSDEVVLVPRSES
ncbi:MAG: bifunctional pyr operon transcriptional regulator/uracil phosphoribosyltransferase PyrR [Gemmatimonadales bacterium]|nr:bifunctional pyr operon transcriptional regulator/uracil phosphoribosyltransferase PyrR [Gemmatimonadales bacterium]